MKYKKITSYYCDALEISEEKIQNIKLGSPFVIYSISDDKQNEIYYYPIISSSSNDIIFIVTVLKSNQTWTYNINTEYVDE